MLIEIIYLLCLHGASVFFRIGIFLTMVCDFIHVYCYNFAIVVTVIYIMHAANAINQRFLSAAYA